MYVIIAITNNKIMQLTTMVIIVVGMLIDDTVVGVGISVDAVSVDIVCFNSVCVSMIEKGLCSVTISNITTLG